MFPLFETIKVLDGIPHHLKWHQKRLEHSFRVYYGVKGHFQIKNTLRIPKALCKGLYRCRLSYNECEMRTEFSEYTIQKINTLKLVEAEYLDYSLKFSDRTSLNELFKKRETCDDILVVKNGLITDSSYANIVLFDGSSWFTPFHPLLKGTQRSRLLSENVLCEKDISVGDLSFFKSFKLINAMRDFDLVDEIPIRNIIE